jgi:hypothetical protein
MCATKFCSNYSVSSLYLESKKACTVINGVPIRHAAR